MDPFTAAAVKGAETGYYRELARLTEAFVRWGMADEPVTAKVHQVNLHDADWSPAMVSAGKVVAALNPG